MLNPQAASLLGFYSPLPTFGHLPPQAEEVFSRQSGVNTGSAKRRQYWVCLQRLKIKKRVVSPPGGRFYRECKKQVAPARWLKPILRPASGVKPGLACSSVHVALVAAFCAQVVQVLFRVFRTHAACTGDSIHQGVFDIARHARRIAANINVCAALQPRP